MATETFSPRLSGDFHELGAAGYEEARQNAVWNGRKPERFPQAIIVAADARDAQEAVRYARRAGLRVGIRSGGHSVVATGVRQDGLLLDLSRLNEIEVDREAKTAWVGPGVRGQDLGRRLQDQGLSFPYGGSATVGLGGYLLTGGYGLNGKALGSGASNIKAIDVITADGDMIRADENSNQEFLWAARGGGYGFFGVVVRFQIQLFDAPGQLTRGAYVFPVEHFDDFATWFFASLDQFDDKLMTLVFGVCPPALDERRVVRITALGFGDCDEETREMFRPLEETPISDLMVLHEAPVATTLEEVWAGVDLLYPKGRRYFADTVWIKDTDDPRLVAGLRPSFENLPKGGSHIMMNPWIPADSHDSALSGTSGLPFHLYGLGTDPSQDPMLREWIASSMQEVLPFSTGVGKINESDLEIRDQHVLAPENEARLEELRAKFDPERRFHSFLRPGA